MGTLIERVLHVFPGIKQGGGPRGYAYHLQNALHVIGECEFIGVLVPARGAEPSPAMMSLRGALKKHLPSWLLAPLLAYRSQWIIRHAFRFFGFSAEQVNEMLSARVVIFHDWRLAHAYLQTVGRPTGQKVLLMSHSPTDAVSELIESWMGTVGPSRIWPSLRNLLCKIELETMLSTDGLVAPCRQALEHYFIGIQKRDAIFHHPIYEIKTGVSERRVQQGREQVLTAWNVPPGAKVIGFFGRRHPHKGYDLFCQAAELAYERAGTNLIFVTAGSGHLPTPNHLPNFRDLGYLSSELADAIAAVDLVVVPNRVSYFDLLILEAMSLGKPVLTSRVGGNVCFGSPGVLFFDELSAECLLSAIERLLADPRKLEEAGRINRSVYEDQYTLREFGLRHQRLAEALLADY